MTKAAGIIRMSFETKHVTQSFKCIFKNIYIQINRITQVSRIVFVAVCTLNVKYTKSIEHLMLYAKQL